MLENRRVLLLTDGHLARTLADVGVRPQFSILSVDKWGLDV